MNYVVNEDSKSLLVILPGFGSYVNEKLPKTLEKKLNISCAPINYCNYEDKDWIKNHFSILYITGHVNKEIDRIKEEIIEEYDILIKNVYIRASSMGAGFAKHIPLLRDDVKAMHFEAPVHNFKLGFDNNFKKTKKGLEHRLPNGKNIIVSKKAYEDSLCMEDMKLKIVPTQIVHGNLDLIAPYKESEIFANSHEDVELHTLKGYGHNINGRQRFKIENLFTNFIIKHIEINGR